MWYFHSELFSSHLRGGMRARAKSQARVQAHDLTRAVRHFVPGGHDPKTGSHFNRRELRLRQAHPVLLGHRVKRGHGAAREKVLRGQQTGGFAGFGIIPLCS